MSDEVAEVPEPLPETPEEVSEAVIEPTPEPVETPAPEVQTGPQGPLPSSKTDDRQENQVAQIPANEPIPPEIPSAPELPVVQPPPEPLSAPQPSAPVSVVAPIIHIARDLLVKARAVVQSTKRKKLDKILEYVTKHGSITNDQVEKLLRVSDATATRYLSQLVKEGKLKQEGKTGKSVKYLKL